MKRFTDTEIWEKRWYRIAPLRAKLLFKYIVDHCDHGGVLDPDWERMSFSIGETVSINDLEHLNGNIKIRNGKLFVPRFIRFQFGQISPLCKQHAPVFDAIKRHFLKDEEWAFEGHSMGINTPTHGAKEKEKEKEPVQETDQGGVQRGGERVFKQPDLNEGKNGKHDDLSEYLAYQSKILELTGRPKNGILRGEEERALADLVREREDFGSELILIESFKSACQKEGRFFPEALLTLLQRWQVTVDRARNYQPRQNQVPIPVQIKTLEDAIAIHPANSQSVAHNKNCSEEQKTDLRNKRARLRELKGA